MKSQLLGLVFLVAGGCKSGAQQSGDAKDTKPPGTAETGTATSPAKDSGSGASLLEGSWELPCGTFSQDPSARLFQTGTKVFRGNDVSITYQAYGDDESCKTKTSAVRTTAIFKLGKAAADGTMTLDVTTTAFFATYQSQDLVDNLNADKACGGGFVINKEKQLTRAACGDDPAFARGFGTIHGLVKLDGSTLYESDLGSLGSEDDGTSATRRPKTVRTRGMQRK